MYVDFRVSIAVVLTDITIVMGATISENDQISNLHQCCRTHEQILLARLWLLTLNC